jgi:diguanylate cyclase (GGDEF)-like protein
MRQSSKISLTHGLPGNYAVEAENTAMALFDRSGRSFGMLPAFLSDLPSAGRSDAIDSIFDCLPQLNDKIWNEIWQKVETGEHLTLTIHDGDFADEMAPTTFRISRFEARRGILAAIERIADGQAFRRRQLQELQRETLEAIASGWSLQNIMDLICRRAEALAPSVICSILAVDAEKRLRPLAGPSLPDYYVQRIDGVAIGPCVGSCGTAAFRGEPVLVTDITSDPLWQLFETLPIPSNLRACWSSPIKERNGGVIGSFAFYYPTPRGPDPIEREIVAACLYLCVIAIEYDETQSRIRKLAFHDAVTDLPNRPHFHRRAQEILQNNSDKAAIHYIDLDDFKDVNDTFGHFVGDLLLKAIAERFKSNCHDSECIARLGGDEFAVLQYPARDKREVDNFARSILSCFNDPFDIDGRQIRIGASIGVATSPFDGTTVDELLRCSDLALYQAKSEGSGLFRVFTSEMTSQLFVKREISTDLRRALKAGEFVPYYQPIVDLTTQTIVSFEALVRWQHPVRGLIPPAEFIPVAEEIGLIDALGELVLKEACREAADWPSDIKIAVNLSPTQLKNPLFVDDLVAILANTGLAPNRLELEITETVPLTANAQVRRVVTKIKELGVGICLDDFGTGYSSLSYLQSFPFDKIKIDLTFVRDIGNSANARAIVQAVTGLARNLGMKTIAEGVETEMQHRWLLTEGCNEAQGYFFGRPMTSLDARVFIALKHRQGLQSELQIPALAQKLWHASGQ